MDENPQNVHPFPRGHLTPVPQSNAGTPKDPGPPRLVSAQRFGNQVVFVFEGSDGQDIVAFEPSNVMFMQQVQMPFGGAKGVSFIGSLLTLRSGEGGLIQIAFQMPPLDFIKVCVHLGLVPPRGAIWTPEGSEAPSDNL